MWQYPPPKTEELPLISATRRRLLAGDSTRHPRHRETIYDSAFLCTLRKWQSTILRQWRQNDAVLQCDLSVANLQGLKELRRRSDGNSHDDRAKVYFLYCREDLKSDGLSSNKKNGRTFKKVEYRRRRMWVVGR